MRIHNSILLKYAVRPQVAATAQSLDRLYMYII